MPKRARWLAASTISLSFLLLAASDTGAQTFQVLHAFSGPPSDGTWPIAPMVIGPDGTLYGTTEVGGNAGSCDQEQGCGTVYSLQPPESAGAAWKETVLYNFTGGADGGAPAGPVVIGPDGVLYGATEEGGTGTCNGTLGCGVVFSLTPPASPGRAWTETVLWDFTRGATGVFPNGIVRADDGVLYGTTQLGGIFNCSGRGCGTVFSLTPPASSGGPWTYRILYKFSTSGPNSPREVMLNHGILYGTTYYGGPGDFGAVFSLAPSATQGAAWTFQVLHNFAGAPADGAYPETAPVMGADGVLYGTASAGGSGICGIGYNTGCGIVYSLSPPASPGGAWTENILYNFNTNGASLYSIANAGVVIGSNGALYGTATYGGPDNQGFLYSLTPPTSSGGPWAETVLHSFTGSSGGAAPESNVVIGKSGELYGTTAGGGVPYPGYGTVFSLQR